MELLYKYFTFYDCKYRIIYYIEYLKMLQSNVSNDELVYLCIILQHNIYLPFDT